MAAIFFLKPSKESSKLIMMRICDSQFKGGLFNYSTREYIHVNRWDVRKKKPKPGNASLDSRLLELERDAIDYIRLNRKGLTREGLRDHLNGLTPKEEAIEISHSASATMVEEWEVYLEEVAVAIGKSGRPVTTKTLYNYNHALETFKKFLEPHSSKNNPKVLTKSLLNIRPMNFDVKLYNQFQNFLKDNYSTNSCAKTLKILKRFVRHLVKGNLTQLNPEEIEYRETAGLKIAVSEEELDKIYHLKLIDRPTEFYDNMFRAQYAKRLNHIRWLFLLQCYTGVRVSDLFRIPLCIKGNFIILETQKVRGKVIQQPLTKRVKEILEKYDYNLPIINEQDYREGIKALYKEINPKASVQIRDEATDKFKTVPVWHEISSHDAVRTFITICDERGMSITDIALMVGKSRAVIEKHYLVSNIKTAQKSMLEKWG